MRIYETLFIIRPDIPEEEVDALVDPLKSVITGSGGAVDKVDKWGKRKLAYRVRKQREGFYVLLQFSTPQAAETVKELERRLRVSDDVIKFLTVRVDERMKRLEKIRKRREKRAVRKPTAPREPAPAPATPGAPAAAAPAAPTAPAAPAAPTTPTAPAAPTTPVAPAAPAAPTEAE